MPDVNIFVKAKDQASKTLGGIGKSVKGLTGVVGSLGLAAPLALGAVAAGVGKLAWDAMELEPTRITFENLAESIGTTSDALLEELKPATMGMVSDAKLMTAANKFMAMGLAETSGEAANLSEMAVKLGMAMGKGPTQAMEEFALMMANQSIPRLDTFGISAATVRARINELMESTKGMTREMAFQQAVMEQGEISMAKVGDISDTTAVKTAQLRTKFEDLKTEIGEALVPVLDAVVTGLLDVWEAAEKGREATEKRTEATYQAAQTEEEFVEAMYDTLPPLARQSILQDELQKAVVDATYAQEYQRRKSQALIDILEPLTESYANLDEEMAATKTTMELQARSVEEVEEAYEGWIDTLGRFKEAVREEMFPDEGELREMGDILYQIYVEENPRVVAARQAYEAERASGEESIGIAQESVDGIEAIYEGAQDRLEETRAGMHGVPDAYDVQAITSEAVDVYKIEWKRAQDEVEVMEEGHIDRMAQLEAGIVTAVSGATSPALEVYRTYFKNVEEAERIAAIGRAEAWMESIGGVAPETKDILAEMVRDGEILLEQIPEAVREDVEASLEQFEWMALGYNENIAEMLSGSEEFEEILTKSVKLGADEAEIAGLRMKKALVDEALEPAIDTSESLREELDKLDGTEVDIYIQYHYSHIGEPGPGPSVPGEGGVEGAITEAGMEGP